MAGAGKKKCTKMLSLQDSLQAKRCLLAQSLRQRLRESAVIFLLFLTGFLVMALTSYHPQDTGWSFVGPVSLIANEGGQVGAWLSDLLLSLLGYCAWFLPVILLYLGYCLFQQRGIPWRWQPAVVISRIVGCLLLLCCGTGLVYLHYHFLGAALPAESGGIVGSVIVGLCLPLFNVTGSTLLLLAGFLLGVTLATGLSWFRLMDVMGRLTIVLAALVQRSVPTLVMAAFNKSHWIAIRCVGYIQKIRKQKQPRVESTVATLPSSAQDKFLSVPRKQTTLTATVPSTTEVVSDINNHHAGSTRPAVELLDEAKVLASGINKAMLSQVAKTLEDKLKDFGVDVTVVAVHPGPVITRYEIQPAPGVKASRISNLAKDLARSLAVISVRVVEVIPGKSVMGIEIPNETRETVFLIELIASGVFEAATSPLSLALGHDTGGQPVVVDLAKMPHLLVAGTTGSGKSVGVNAMLLSLLFKSGPAEVRLLLIDPKMLELSVYEGIPHLLAPVVTDMKEAANALRWCVAEMERRYKLMAAMGVRNIAGYNEKIREAISAGQPLTDPFFDAVGEGSAPELGQLPFLVVVVDEFADMIMIVGKKVEALIARIAQKARAAGIHLILATQRPSVDVITGLIKANVPTRISFQVSSKIDSRTIIDQGGAEQLLGHGDMLYLAPGTSVPIRVHGAFVSDNDVHRVVADWLQRGQPCYIDDILGSSAHRGVEGSAMDTDDERDPLYDEAVAFVLDSRKASISAVQRRLKIGYNRAARIIEAMEAAQVISPMQSNGNRDVLVPKH